MSNDFKITKYGENVTIIDNFYKYPYEVWEYALKQKFHPMTSLYQSFRTLDNYFADNKEVIKCFEKYLGIKIKHWNDKDSRINDSNGIFQYILKNTKPLVHTDTNSKYAAVSFINPNGIKKRGFGIYKFRLTNSIYRPTIDEFKKAVKNMNPLRIDYILNEMNNNNGKPVNYQLWERVKNIDYVFNRLVLFHGNIWHSNLGGFGTDIKSSRMYQTFFFS